MNRNSRMKLLAALSCALLAGAGAARPPLLSGSAEGDWSTSELDALFKRLDVNGDGMLTRAEASADQRITDRVWQWIDLTKDNLASRTEFLSYKELRDIDTYGTSGPQGASRGPENAPLVHDGRR